MELKRRSLFAHSLICFSYLIILHEINAVPTLKASKSIHEELELDPKYKMTWSIEEGSDKIQFDLVVETTGFVGFGLSPTGGMDGADMIIAGVFENGSIYFSDRHGVGKDVEPEIDAVVNWQLNSCTEDDGVTFITVTRLLNTCDDEDIAITMDTAKLIYSYGATDEIYYHGRDNRGSRSINLLYPPKKADLSGYQNWTITVNTPVPTRDTLVYFPQNSSEIRWIKHWDSILLEPNAKKYTHHVDRKKCRAPPGATYEDTFEKFVGLEGTSCYDDPGEYPIHYCETYVLTWAVGRGLTLLPNDVGYAASEGNDDAYYVMEVHYDNPTEDNVEPFTTGLNIYYTTEERENKADLLGVGHFKTWSLIVPPNVSSYTVAGHCNPQCTSYFPENGITVFSGLMHSHLSGRKLKLRHFRDGKELPWISADNNFDFNFQENKNINNIVIKPGDQITYECVYDTTWKNGSAVVSGLSSRDEMCISWFWYYPKIDMNYCYSFYPYEKVQAELGIQNYTWNGGPYDPPPIITAPENMANKTYQEVLDKVIEWTPQKIEKLEKDHRYGEHYSFCFNGKTSDLYPIENPIIKYAEFELEYQPDDVCIDSASSNPPEWTTSEDTVSTEISSSNRNLVNSRSIFFSITTLCVYFRSYF